MKPEQWLALRKCAEGEAFETPPVALIIDSPWIPGYLGISTLDYLTVPDVWLQANLRVESEFPGATFLPGFWVEMGMAAEPSGFGARVSLYHDRTPAVHPLLGQIEDAARLSVPDPRTDGLMPVILNYYRHLEPRINDAGHVVKIVAARGPLAVAAHLMGVTELLLAAKLNPAEVHRLLDVTTTLVRTWLEAQAEVLREVEGILVLDDLAGFFSPKDYAEFAHPYLERVFSAFPRTLKIFHNDTDNPVSYPRVRELGVHIFNFTHLQPLAKVRQLTGPDLCLMGNVPPLEVLTKGDPIQVAASTRACLAQHPERRGLLLSAGGGVSPGTPGPNLHALIETARAGWGASPGSSPS